MVLESIEEAKEALLDFYGDKEELKDAITNGNIEHDIDTLSEKNIDDIDYDMIDWLREDRINIRYVNKTITRYGCINNSLISLLEMSQIRKNKDLLEKALYELKREYGIENLHSKKSLKETIIFIKSAWNMPATIKKLLDLARKYNGTFTQGQILVDTTRTKLNTLLGELKDMGMTYNIHEGINKRFRNPVRKRGYKEKLNYLRKVYLK